MATTIEQPQPTRRKLVPVPGWEEQQPQQPAQPQEQPATQPQQPTPSTPSSPSTQSPQPQQTPQQTPSTPSNPTTQQPQQQQQPEPVKEQTALERIPHDRKGKPIFEEAESPELAWNALVEFAGDAKSAQEIADMMVANKKRAYETANKDKPKGNDPSEILNSQRSINATKEKAKGEYEMWQKIAAEQQRREDAIESQRAAQARQEAAALAEAEKAEREAREEAERVEREALNGIPEWHMDTPQNARARGSRRHGGQLIKRQEEFSDDVAGNALEVKFSQNDMPIGHYSVIEADILQPSHMDGQRNPLHFLDEAQPKDRSEAVSVHAARQIAENIRPEEITGSATAYTGAPTVNTRGEVIQGNNRSAALRYLWDNNLPEQQAAYKQYLIDNAERFGLDPEKIRAMKKPVLVNRLRVEDDEAIRLGQMTAQDTESGGIERIKPKNVAQKLGDEMRTFANLLLRGDEEATFGQLVDRNGAEVLRWMNEKGYISNTQYQSAFDSKGNLTAEAKNDLQKTLYQAVFRGGAQQLEEMFDKLPAKAQRAILATAFRDMDSPLAGKMLPEIQASIAAYVQLMNDPTFANAKNMEELLRAIETFKKATALDDRFETYVPADNFSNFALHLAAMYKASDMSQLTIASYFNRMYDLAQGKTAATLFEEADGTQYALADIVKKVFDFEYKPAKNGNNNDNNGSLNVAVSNTVSQGGEPRGAEPPAGGEQNPAGAEPTERGGGTILPVTERGGQGDIHGTQRPEPSGLPQTKTEGLDYEYGLSDEVDHNGRPFVLTSKGDLEFGRIEQNSGLTAAPILLSEGIITNSKTKEGYGLIHIEARHGNQIRQNGYSNALEFIEDVAKNWETIIEAKDRNGNPTFRLIAKGKHNNTIMVELSGDGTYWNINTAGIFKTSYGKNAKEVYNRHTTDKPTAESAEASQETELSGTAESSRMNASTSGGKITKSALNKQENGAESSENSGAYTIAATSYTNKKGKTTPMHLVTSGRELTPDELRAGKELAKESRGWWDREKGGFMMRSEEAAKALAEMLAKGDEEAIADAQPLSIKDMVAVTDSAPKPKKVDLESLVNDLKERGEAKLSDHADGMSVDKKTHHNQPASSDKGQQDLTTGSSVDDDANSGAKVIISKQSAKHELNKIIHNYVNIVLNNY